LDFDKNENLLSLIKNKFILKYFPDESADNPFELVFAGNFISTYDFYLSKNKSTYIIESITPSIIICISYLDFQNHYNLINNRNNTDLINNKVKFKLEIALISIL
jgi:hypothetical protein